MEKLLYSKLLENISYSIAAVLNENNIDTEQKRMYEQDKLDNETWEQMANRIGFTKWYLSTGNVLKKNSKIGDIYAKRRQRWLANNCKDERIIKKEIENLEDCIEFSYLNDDNFLESGSENITELKQQIKSLQDRIDQLSTYNEEIEKRQYLNLKNIDMNTAFDPYELSYNARNYDESYRRLAINMFENLKEQLKTMKCELYPRGSVGLWRLRSKQESDDFERYKVLIVTDNEMLKNEKYIDELTKILNTKYNIQCTKKEIYFIVLNDTRYYSTILPENINNFKQFMRSGNENLEIQCYNNQKCGNYAFDYHDFFFFIIKIAGK